MENDDKFNRILRKSTRDIHSISDALVNAKLAFAMSDNGVWSEGLLVFYEIFRFLEEAMIRQKDGFLGEMFIDGMARTAAFEEDLSYYLGQDWKIGYTMRESVKKYVDHMANLEKENPNLLIAYVYHLYMGLLSGGQILKKKRQLASKIGPFFSTNKTEGYAVTDFGDINTNQLKKDMIERVNSISEKLDHKTKNDIIIEGRKVFELNNEIIKSVKGTNRVLIKHCATVVGVAIVSYLIYLKLK